MTREKMCKITWRAYMKLMFKTDLLARPTEVMLISINFETEVAIVQPFPESHLEEEMFPVSIDFIELPRPEPKLLKN